MDLGKVPFNFFPVSEFVTANFLYVKSMKDLELKVLDYAMVKETMDGL